MQHKAIGSLSEMVAPHESAPKSRLTLSQQLKIERDMLFGKSRRKPTRRKKERPIAEAYEISEQVALMVALALDTTPTAIFQSQEYPKFLLITLCYHSLNFSMKECQVIFNCDRKYPNLAVQEIQNRALIDPEFNTLFNNLKTQCHANILL